MYPEPRVIKYRSPPVKRQRGFLIPLAIFIVVVMGLLALALARTTTQTGLANAQELVSLQAFYAAESGAQRGMNKLFPPGFDSDPNVPVRAGVNGRCMNSFTETLNFSGIQGLAACSAEISCGCTSCNPTDATSSYTITSIGRCGAGVISAVRTIRVGSFLDRDQE
jgi:MSHA biogenesis protein MshP